MPDRELVEAVAAELWSSEHPRGVQWPDVSSEFNREVYRALAERVVDMSEAAVLERVRAAVEALRAADAKTLAWMEADPDVQVFIEGFRQDVLAAVDAEEVRDA